MAIEERYWRGEPDSTDEPDARRVRAAQAVRATLSSNRRGSTSLLTAVAPDARRFDSSKSDQAAARSPVRWRHRPASCWRSKSIAILPRDLEAAALPNVTVVTADVLSVDLVADPDAVARRSPSSSNQIRVVGNLPYNISSPILFALLALASKTHGVRDAMLMLQKEVADRLVARVGTGEYGVLTVLTRLNADVTRVLSLPPGAFRPPPKVHSAVVRLTFRPPNVADRRPAAVRPDGADDVHAAKEDDRQRAQAVCGRTGRGCGQSAGRGRGRSQAASRNASAGRNGCAGAGLLRARKLKLCYSFRRNPPVFPGAPSGLKR